MERALDSLAHSVIITEGHIMTHTSASAVVRNCRQAWTGGDIDRAMTHIVDDITCRAPGVDA